MFSFSSRRLALRAAGSSIALAALAIALCGVLACTSQSGETGAPGSGLRSGQQIFASTCAACHGIDGQSQENWHVPKEDGTLPAPPLNGDGHTWHHGGGRVTWGSEDLSHSSPHRRRLHTDDRPHRQNIMEARRRSEPLDTLQVESRRRL